MSEPITVHGWPVDATTTMTSELVDGTLSVVYPHPDYPGTRRDASVWARQYGRDHRARFAYIGADVVTVRATGGRTVDAIRYRYRQTAR